MHSDVLAIYSFDCLLYQMASFHVLDATLFKFTNHIPVMNFSLFSPFLPCNYTSFKKLCQPFLKPNITVSESLCQSVCSSIHHTSLFLRFFTYSASYVHVRCSSLFDDPLKSTWTQTAECFFRTLSFSVCFLLLRSWMLSFVYTINYKTNRRVFLHHYSRHPRQEIRRQNIFGVGGIFFTIYSSISRESDKTASCSLKTLWYYLEQKKRTFFWASFSQASDHQK